MPVISLRTILLSSLVIRTRLPKSNSCAIVPGKPLSAVFKSVIILSIESTSTDVCAKPSRNIDPGVEEFSSMRILEALEEIFNFPTTTDAVMLGMLSEFICCAILDAVGLELVSYVFDGNPKSLNADPDNVSSSSLVSIINTSPDI